ncbi:peroxisomal membrane protein 13 [Iris pallida]|uniref:Peroxin-13 n=1 Tax=Iris pallida TaxID=29817 RepID=A0AAX6I9F6_IRIPA|nr:peroxisomal membrane protein 13 [Iris pallida]
MEWSKRSGTTRAGRTEVRTGHYIVVGSGIVGCPLAVTFFHCVLLLERDGALADFPSLCSLDGFLQTFVSEDLRPPLRPSSPRTASPMPRSHPGGSSVVNVDQILLNSNLGNSSPPKPWERAGASSGSAPFKPPSSGNTSEVVEASGTARPGEIVSNANAPANRQNTLGRPVPSRLWKQNYGNNNGVSYN